MGQDAAHFPGGSRPVSAPTRLLVLALLGWAGVRAATSDMVPGTHVWSAAEARPVRPQIVPTIFPPLDPVELADAIPGAARQLHFAVPNPASHAAALPAFRRTGGGTAAAQLLSAASVTQLLPEPEPLFYSPIPQLDEWPLSRLASTAAQGWRNQSPTPTAQPPRQDPLDRLQLSSWALLRSRNGSGALATGGTLGGSQAGARLTYALDRQLALSFRTSTPVGAASGGEVAAGLRTTPIPAIPVSITAERRQAIGPNGGRSAFALFLEGGLYQRPMPLGFGLDAYAQAGVVGARRRDLFADGGMTLSRPLLGPLSGGIGVWAGAQPGLYRVDAGPRVSMKVRRNMRVDLDWRQRLAGNAEPGSGPALTLAADF